MLSFKQFLYEAAAPPATPAPAAPDPAAPAQYPTSPTLPAPSETVPYNFPLYPNYGDTWVSPTGYTWRYSVVGWNIIESPNSPNPKPAPKPAKPKPPAEKPKPKPRPKPKPTVRSPVTGEPVNPDYRPQR